MPKRILTMAMLLAAWALGAAAQPVTEQDLIAVLRAGSTPAEKEAACRQLKRIGTARSVPVLAGLLTDDRLGTWARDALETMPVPEAGQALLAALSRTRGLARAGVIASLGARRERKALPQLVALLNDTDAAVAASAATALGRLGGPEAIRALWKAASKPAPATRVAAIDALLACAERLLAERDVREAAAIYQAMWSPRYPSHVRTAAFRGLVLASGKDAVRHVVGALQSNDPVAHGAALPWVRDLRGPGVTAAFARLVTQADPRARVPVLFALGQRGDPAAVGAVLAAARSRDAALQTAALRVLGDLGDASHVAFLARTAAQTGGSVREAARQSLVRLGRGDVRASMLKLLTQAPPPVQQELIRALAARGERPAAATLLNVAEGGDEAVAEAALQALTQLGDQQHTPALMRLLTRERRDSVREAAETALVAIATRSPRPDAVSAAALAAMPTADPTARCSLLRVAAQIGGPGVLDALRQGVRDEDPQVRDAAVRALAEFGGRDAMGDLLALSREAPTPALRTLALRGYWRLVELTSDRPAEERLAMCEAGLAAATRPEERRAGLAALARVHHPQALRMAEAACSDAAIREEAELACVQIATRLLATARAEAEAALRRLADSAASQQARTEARAAVDALSRYSDYVMPWLAAGPYRQAGKQCQELFDIAFPPETQGPEAAQWRLAPSPPDPLLFWQVDLASVVQGDHAVAYVKTRVYSPREQPVLLEIGNDDGIKLWVNGELVHANNAVRGLAPGQDRVQARLKQGWNDFFAKVTQHTLGCGLCLRIAAPDGSRLEGLRYDPQATEP